MSELFPRTQYLQNRHATTLVAARDATFSSALVLDAIDDAHMTLDRFVKFKDEDKVDVFAILGMRNLSAFIGELFAAAMIKVGGELFCKNPHQDGYPDILVMDDHGRRLWAALEGRFREKGPFSPFLGGGLEVKATCGDVLDPKACAIRGLEKPAIGDQRVKLLKGYVWKAHHRETNNLLSIFWDFINGDPRIIAVFYTDSLSPSDWGKLAKPKEGGGRTTSVSNMTRGGVRKLFDNWVIMLDDPSYIEFFERHNKAMLPR